jgi:hypothetical protein
VVAELPLPQLRQEDLSRDEPQDPLSPERFQRVKKEGTACRSAVRAIHKIQQLVPGLLLRSVVVCLFNVSLDLPNDSSA